jgi:hypothetical protein
MTPRPEAKYCPELNIYAFRPAADRPARYYTACEFARLARARTLPAWIDQLLSLCRANPNVWVEY